MKTTIKTGLAVLLLLAISCTKESVNKNSSPQLQATTEQALSFTIGQRYGGGIIFYIDNTGQHGLIADTVDLPRATWWNPKNKTYTVTGATAVSIGTGKSNTKKIVLSQGDSGRYAARECWHSRRNGYNDWFLPSLDELNELYLQKNVVGGFADGTYWSSSEGNSNFAWFQDLVLGGQDYDYKFNADYVRAVRAF